MRRILFDPALIFIVCGAALFALHTAVAPEPEPERGVVELSADTRDRLVAEYTARTGGPPDGATTLRLIDEWFAETVLVREAIAIGMPETDPIIRQRLLQKMEYLLDETADIPEPDDATLNEWLERNPTQYMLPPRFSFEHVFFSERGGSAGSGDVAAVSNPRERAEAELDALRNGLSEAGRGDPFVGGREFERRIRAQVVGAFGEEFTSVLDAAPLNEWFGPIRSPSGWHLVRVSAREPERRAPLDEIRERVVRAWRAEQGSAARDQRIAELRERYRLEQVEGSGAAP